ncbi:hypothetical protein A2U01_0032612, partial [Trifolium medium]|nr:hypothetical protein [Trifolium medium]
NWVEEFYANAFGRRSDDFTSYTRGVKISYAPNTIDGIFGFRPEEHCAVRQQCDRNLTGEEYTEMLQTLALPGKDWCYDSQGRRSRLQATEMMPVAKGWVKWLVRNFECCSNETEIIMSRCHAVDVI